VIRKPDPMAMNILLKELKVEISDVSYIGDSRYDATFSENCGCDYYLFTYGYDKEEIIKQYKPIAFLQEATDLLKYF
jgi:phosphoglycolate phosphatase-like HAD superfamily hydrolase